MQVANGKHIKYKPLSCRGIAFCDEVAYPIDGGPYQRFWPEESADTAPQPTVGKRRAGGVELPLRPEMLTLTLAPCEGLFMANSLPFCPKNGIKALFLPPSSPLSRKNRNKGSWNVPR